MQYKTILDRVSISAHNIPQMVKFYNLVIGASLKPFAVDNYTLYQGEIANLNIIITPYELNRIEAEESRYRFSFIVPNLEKALKSVDKAGGIQVQNVGIDGNEKYCGVVDPDGNSIELIQLLPQPQYA